MTILRILCLTLALFSSAQAQSPVLPGPGLPVAGGGGGYTAQGVHFSSTGPQGLDRGGSLTGVSNTFVGAISFWFKATANDANTFYIFTSNRVIVSRQTSGRIQLVIGDGVVGNVVNVQTSSTVYTAANGNWHHYMASWNGNAAGAVDVKVYTDGVSDLGTNSSSFTGNAFDYTAGNWFVSNPGLPIDADLADVWFDTGIAYPTQLDLSVLSNRQKFINSGAPVNLGTTGSTPSGTAPPVFFSGSVASWNTNKATGGGFTLNSGPLTAAATNPP